MPAARILAINDTGSDRIIELAAAEQVRWIPLGRTGTGSGFFYSVHCLGYSQAAAMDDVDMMFKMDTDALIVGDAPDEEARRYFSLNPHVGLIGAHRHTPTGARRSFTSAATAIDRATKIRRQLRSPAARRIGRLVAQAERHGYEMGEHVLGGTSIMSGAALRALLDHGLLHDARLGRVRIVEDHTLSLCVRAVGFEVGDFATGTRPMFVTWRGLPWPAREIAAMPHKKVIHSVSDWGDQRESDVRRLFAQKRRAPDDERPEPEASS